tara:strand:+ start:1306 stop:2211 length:906 start_codon:yes stop_codon:yes gene_type:complete
MTTTDKQKSYYGVFFWVAAISFIVPFFVAVRAFDVVGPATKPEPAPDASGVDNALWDYLLKAYVEKGLVDYDAMGRDYIFRTYLKELGGAQPDKLATDDDRLALLCNAYNAFVINGVITHKIRASVNDYVEDGTGFFDLKEHIFANQTLSLNDIEHTLIRERFDEPRIHVALVCAAVSCPSLRAEAFEGARLDAQLADQARIFANSPTHVAYDGENKTVHLSRILSWYGEDWDNHGGYLTWLAERVEDPDVAEALRQAEEGSVAVEFNEYDWVLNTQNERAPGGSADPSSGAFGSGSIPNE